MRGKKEIISYVAYLSDKGVFISRFVHADPLLCALGDFTYDTTFPPDGICTILIYAEVKLSGPNFVGVPEKPFFFSYETKQR